MIYEDFCFKESVIIQKIPSDITIQRLLIFFNIVKFKVCRNSFTYIFILFLKYITETWKEMLDFYCQTYFFKNYCCASCDK